MKAVWEFSCLIHCLESCMTQKRYLLNISRIKEYEYVRSDSKAFREDSHERKSFSIKQLNLPGGLTWSCPVINAETNPVAHDSLIYPLSDTDQPPSIKKKKSCIPVEVMRLKSEKLVHSYILN